MSGKVPRALPWAGMRCPFGTRGMFKVQRETKLSLRAWI